MCSLSPALFHIDWTALVICPLVSASPFQLINICSAASSVVISHAGTQCLSIKINPTMKSWSENNLARELYDVVWSATETTY